MINKFYFNHRGENFVIHAKDVEDAFNPWKRLFGRSNFVQSEFEKVLIDAPEDSSNCLMMVGDSLTREEIRELLHKKKIGLPVTKKLKPIKINIPLDTTEMEKYLEEHAEELVDCPEEIVEISIPVKRGRGRPKKIPEIKTEKTMGSYFV